MTIQGRLGLSFTPLGLAFIGAQELALGAGRIYLQYRNATSQIEEQSPKLALALTELRNEYQNIRIVAHSMGCKLVLDTLKDVPAAMRPDELHLCGPALCEDDIKDILPHASPKTSVYYSERDFVLNCFYSAYHRDQEEWAVGSVGLTRKYPNVKCVDVDEHFDNLVHFQYKRNFSKFATRYDVPLIGDGLKSIVDSTS
eukprot:TRINITY_DN1113_c2_g1_i2.p2 TRINITY_DN1113_c2_g1~~TRINITY_DN1113_c2_g1_i2.p2  ORF type:complete len:199 (+),score=29.10 TRINITY_DN1113_c2_g1_i2:404-1000(+)